LRSGFPREKSVGYGEVPAIGKESMYGEQLGEEVGGRLAVHVGRGPNEEGTPALSVGLTCYKHALASQH
jgi:hypothetical protein